MSKAAAKDLRQAAARIDRLSDDTVRAAATHAVESAINIGGTFGAVKLRARVVASKSNARETSVTVWPTPAASWSIASYGRSSVRPTKKEALRFKAAYGRVVHANSVQRARTTGDRRVEKLARRLRRRTDRNRRRSQLRRHFMAKEHELGIRFTSDGASRRF